MWEHPSILHTQNSNKKHNNNNNKILSCCQKMKNWSLNYVRFTETSLHIIYLTASTVIGSRRASIQRAFNPSGQWSHRCLISLNVPRIFCSLI
ncbi:Uncharacterized protein APZ42_015178 [Daphnia magna]|uniref:Uncharacterized protein n=1 Tax=Daphnia magna TaxID=35525 RepID=A0A0P5DG98_9CRUS|nr:Uncharacterized protein APZ42_015178 [Daphnia magna]